MLFTREARTRPCSRAVTALEAVLAVGLIGACLGVATAYHRVMLRRVRALVLRAQLRSFRAKLAFLDGLGAHRPVSLEALVRDDMPRVRLGGGGWGDVEATGTESLVDPFGIAYAYDPKAGTVRSGSRGYEAW